MIAPDADFDGAPLMRKEFALAQGRGNIDRAVLSITSLGIFEATVNGAAVGPDVFSPGWSSYEWRLRLRTYQVAGLLSEVNVIGVSLGNGWFRGRLGFMGKRHFYGDELGVFAQLDVFFADGHRQTVATDDSWRAGPSATSCNDLYDGQTIDARGESTAWTLPGHSSDEWVGVHPLDFDTGRLTEPVGPVVVRHESLLPARIWTSPQGHTLIDFGQNLVGWLRCSVKGPAGGVITVKHAEVLEQGELGTRPLRDARATDIFILSGGQDVFEPTKTFHGFRYVQLEGWPGDVAPGSVEAVVVHSDLRRTGEFVCSNPLVNQLHRNVVWSLRGNFLDLPTDCPQRNERLGWTGDIAVFAPTAAFLYDVQDFLRDWLLDLEAEQQAADGKVPFVVPDILKYDQRPAELSDSESTAMWSDAAVWVPWCLWQAYGDLSVLGQTFESMAAHTRRVEGLLSPSGLWDSGFQFADWLDPDAPADDPAAAKADKGVVATACIYRSARIVAQAAELLERSDDATYFRGLADRVRRSFNDHYVSADGSIISDCPTVYSLAITFGLLDSEEKVEVAGNRLAEHVARTGYRISTGFAGTPFVTWALSETGHLDTAYRLLLEQECPSWLYPVRMGATTIWERWDSMLPDGSINPGAMTSFNHYALGAVADWLHQVVGGLRPEAPGYSLLRVAPRPGVGVSWAKTSLMTAHGRIVVDWQTTPRGLHMDLDLPESVQAWVDLPGALPRLVGGGHHSFDA